MATLAIYAHLKSKPGKEAEVEAFLKSALPLAEKEPGTTTWYAFQEDEGSYGIFDTFDTEQARQAHLARWYDRQGADEQGGGVAGVAPGDS